MIDATPYPWPYDGQVMAARTALVIAGNDLQSCSLVPADPTVIANLSELRRRLGAAGVLVVLVRHDLVGFRGELSVCPSPAEPLVESPDDVVVRCGGHDGFHSSVLETVLRRAGRTHLILGGFGFETAVHSTLRSANDRGLECLTVTDAAACVDPSLHRAAVSTIEMSGGIFGAVAPTSAVLHYFSSESER